VSSVLRPNKRFYDKVGVGPDPEGSGFSVSLAGRPVRTPAGARLRLPSAALAAAVANEWLTQEERIRPETMPLTRLAATAIDRMAGHRLQVIDALASYAASDLLCYRAVEPDDLVALQAAVWQPLVDWAAERWGARLSIAGGVLPIAQPDDAITALRRAIDRCSDLELTGVGCAVEASGSLLIGLALLDGRIDAAAAAEAALLDERWQAGRWGVDEEAERRRREITSDLHAAAAFLSLARAA
jgi:chaperone required for assembly of F1-ATPase